VINSNLFCAAALAAAMIGHPLSPAHAAAPATVNAIGTVEPDTVVDVNTRVPGVIVKVDTDFGKRVKKGELLVELDSNLYCNAVDQAVAGMRTSEAKLAVAKAEAALSELEVQRCVKRGADKNADTLEVEAAKAAQTVAQAKVQTALANIDEQKTKIAAAKINLDACQICSPLDGVVIVNRANTGQFVAPAANVPSLLTIADDSKMMIWASVVEDDIAQVRVGQTARFACQALPGKTFTGRVSQIRLDAAAHQNQVFYTVVVTPDQSDTKLLPYMTVNVEINVGQHQ
jgi:HlyD family secretion protein